jgi:lantibiotic modifying enzyme
MPFAAPPNLAIGDASKRYALDVADRIGARLVRDAFCAGERCNWIGANMDPVGGSWSVVHRALEADLYAGSGGIALFLAALSVKTGERLYRRMALAAALSSLDRAGELRAHPSSVFSGRLGVGYAIARVGEYLGEPVLVERARAELLAASQVAPEGHALDLVGGSAGAVGVLLAAHRQFGDDQLLQGALQHGNHLLSAGLRDEHGDLCWDTLPGQAQRPLTGLAHGAAGIVLALEELASATGERRFAEAAQAGLRYEDRWFNQQLDNWPDFRLLSMGTQPSSSAPCGLAWCHGAPGIGLQRLRSYLATNSSESRKAAVAAGRAVAKAVEAASRHMPADASLCHGLCGLLELLMELGRAKLAPEAEALARRTASALSRAFDASHRGFPCGVPGWSGEVPGLMLGLAGIGGFFLRVDDASAFPLMLLPGIDLRAATKAAAPTFTNPDPPQLQRIG